MACLALGLALLAGVAGASGPSDFEPPGVRRAPGWELFAGTNVPAFSLDLDTAAMQSLRQAPREWAHATLRLGKETFRDVAVHIKGSEGSLQPIDRRPSLTVSFNKFAPGREFFGLHKIHFNNTAEDPTFMTEVICGELFRQAGVPAARSAHGTLTLNGRSLGLYVVKEGLTKQFLAQYFRQTDGDFYDAGFQKDIDKPFERIGGVGPENQSDRLQLLAAAREPDLARRWARLKKLLDTDRFISMLAMSTLTWNWDGYPMAFNNYRVYHDPASDRMVFIVHGLDQMFWQPQGSIYPPFKGLLARSVMQVPEARQLYRERLRTLHAEVFQVPRLHRRVDELAALITPYRPETERQAPRLKNLIAGRARSVGAQLQASNP
jgi:spore coat protein H